MDQGQEKTTIEAKVKAKESKDQKLFAEHSEITKRCMADLEDPPLARWLDSMQHLLILLRPISRFQV